MAIDTFNFGFQGGNPPVSGAGNHQDGELVGIWEEASPAHINLLEYAAQEVGSGVVRSQTKINQILDWIQANAFAAGGLFRNASGTPPDDL